MAFEIFGFEILSKKKNQEEPKTVVVPAAEDGSTVISSSAAAYYAQVVDMDTSIKNENDLIRRYREIANHPECDAAIEEITNEAICIDKNGDIVKLNLDDTKLSNGLKKKIQDEFDEVLYLLEFDEKAHDLFRSWYIDGRQYHILTLDPDKPKLGIQKIQLVDSRKIRKIKKIEKKKDPKTGVDIVVKVDEFYIYNERGIEASSAQGIKLSLDSVLYCPSGLFDANSNLMFSYLHKAVKPVNQLKMLEDAVVINTIARAPERRVFYIDVGNLPRVKAEQYVTDIMNRYKNKIVYDASTGEVRDDRKHMSMLEDYWMPRREGGKGTEITTIQGSGQLIANDLITYFQQKLYQSLNVPISRLIPQQNFSLGRSNEITRDELKFNKFISRLRSRFSNMLLDALRVQLVAKNVISADDWEELSKGINIEYVNDNNFTELKESELLQNRLATLQQIDQYVGKYFSPEWVMKNVLRLNEEDQKDMASEIDNMDPKFLPVGSQPVPVDEPQESDPNNPTQPPISGT